MDRLTNKLANGKGYTYKYNDFGCFDKLGQLEDIEEELGIDLLTLFKALKDGIYCYSDNGNDILFEKIEHCVPYMTKQLHTRGRLSIIHGIKSEEREKHFAIKDYGKTWALKKEDLE